MPNAAKAIREANRLGVKVFVITNQSGIARGMLSEYDLMLIHRRLEQLLAARNAYIDGIFYCPHHPEFGEPQYRKVCTCRKPKTGMLEQAARKYNVDLRASFVVGDRCVDMMAGARAGCGTVLVLTGYGATEREECLATTRVDHIAPDIYNAWQHIRLRLDKNKLRTSR